MTGDAAVLAAIADETRALLERVARLKPFVLEVPMVLAAGPSFDAQIAIERHLWRGRRELGRKIERFLHWLEHPRANVEPARAQQGFVALRLAFNVVLDQLDIFAEAMTQRSEAGVGVWLSGLDEVARDALSLPGLFEPPPVLCYLARAPGGAIRRARTRLPGGGDNPVAIIRLPRERMIGSGIASSLVHEVGHQGAALLDLVASLRADIAARARRENAARARVWWRWSRWISEIVADFWAVARIGVASTAGLIGVVSLPRAFVFRDNGEDPHPTPWLRVLLSTAIGDALYPHPQWQRLAAHWHSLYPLERVSENRRRAVVEQARSIPELVGLLVNHRASALRGRTLAEALASSERAPPELAERWSSWRHRPHAMTQVPPSLAFAVIGQARSNRVLTPQAESDLLVRLLEHHAMRGTLDRTAVCAVPRARASHRINSHRVRQEESHVG